MQLILNNNQWFDWVINHLIIVQIIYMISYKNIMLWNGVHSLNNRLINYHLLLIYFN